MAPGRARAAARWRTLERARARVVGRAVLIIILILSSSMRGECIQSGGNESRMRGKRGALDLSYI